MSCTKNKVLEPLSAKDKKTIQSRVTRSNSHDRNISQHITGIRARKYKSNTYQQYNTAKLKARSTISRDSSQLYKTGMPKRKFSHDNNKILNDSRHKVIL